MATNTDTQFASRFPGITADTFVGNTSTLKDWIPTENTINTGMLSDIARAYIYAPDTQENFYARFLQSALGRGDSIMSARVSEIASKAYDPNAADSALFDGTRPTMISNVAKKNLSRQIRLELNEYWTKQFTQVPEMYGDIMAAMSATINACYLDDMWTASKEYFSGSTRGAQASQLNTLTNGVGADGFGLEMTELLWKISQKEFGYKSTAYNASKFNTKSDTVHIALKKDVEFPAFKKLLSETFNPEMLRITSTIDYVDDFATPAGAPSGAGELIGIVADSRAYKITPMPDTLTTESFRNPARRATAYFTTYEYAFQQDPFFNVSYIFAPSS